MNQSMAGAGAFRAGAGRRQVLTWSAMTAARRRLPLLATILFATALPTGCGGSSGPINGGAAYRHLEALVAIGPRPFGSPELGKAADYITAELKKLGLQPQRQEVMHEKEKKLIRNLWVQIDGDDPAAGPILMIGAHYDTKLAEGLTGADAKHNHTFVGAIDGGGGPAVLIELARALKERTPKPKCNVWLYWIDAEESIDWTWNEQRALLGSQAFCEQLSKEKILSRVKAFVLIDLIGSKDYKIDRDGNSDGRLQELFERAAKAMGEEARVGQFPTALRIEQIKEHFRQKGEEPNWGCTDDHIVFRRYGVPSVLLIDFERRIPGTPQDDPRDPPKTDFEQWWHTAAGNLVMQALPELEAFVTGRK
jgi:glutaminyl-peptide cyclotransferase